MSRYKIKFLGLLIALLTFEISSFAFAHYNPSNNPVSDKVRRFSLIIGKNEGGSDRSKLRYAVSDAQSFSRVMEDLGGLESENRVLLTKP